MNSALTPPQSDSPEAQGAVMQAHIARQPIVDRKQQIVGYELFARESGTAEQAPAHHTAESDSVLLFNALSNIGAERLFGEKLAFINCVVEDLQAEHLDIVFPDRIVLEVPRIYGDDPAGIAAVAAALKHLKERGFQLAAGPFAAASPYAAWLPFLGFIKADVQSLSANVAVALQRRAESWRNLRLVAERVETPGQFKTYFDAGYHFFQGYYFARPQTISAKVINPAYANVLQLMNLVMRQADLGEIELVLKRDPALSFKLLRYINSSGFGLMSEVTSFRHAAAILGYKKLFRWLALLLATVPGSAASPAIARTAITRGRMMELLAKGSLSDEDADNAFVVGIFSMLDAMLGVPMEKALAEITLSEQVVMALRHDSGLFGSYLQLVRAVEQRDFDNLDFLASALGIPGWRVGSVHLAALAWVEDLGI
ncbi:MAG: HDOD domain-containing protein [Thiomonas sp.]|uniref:EAL and HDOD domain-containing protein n=1 Tax=Thiomonas sp. TaxID=2047785 RepID=UPI002A35E3AB|nr:HDOD domain-containing protein [Thiomonas sp.]MDY0331395.1 HDOD domain-containing protein [Thiomonas sp.]